MPEIDSYSLCPTCELLDSSDDPSVEHFDEFAYLRAPAEFDRFPIVTTDARHRISILDVLAEYDMPEKVRCSMLPRSHPHKHGYVVRTRCDLVLKIGNDCGEYMVDGIERVRLHAKSARQFQTYAATAPERVRRLREQYAEAADMERRIWAFRDLLRDEGGPFYDEIRNAYQTLRGSDAARATNIPGAVLWDFGRPQVTRLASRVRALRAESEGWKADRPGLTRWREIFSEIKELDDAVADFTAWARRAVQHMTREGMTAACRVVDSEWQSRTVDAFDPLSGLTVQRTEQVFVRTRARFQVVDGGVEILGRMLPIVWP